MSTIKESFTVHRERKEARGESDYLRQLENAAKMPPAKKRKGKSLPSGVEDEG